MVLITSICLRSHSIWLTVSETWLMSSRIRSSVFTDSSMSAVGPGRVGIAQDRERLGEGLAVHLQAHRVCAGRDNGSDLGRLGSPVRDRPRRRRRESAARPRCADCREPPSASPRLAANRSADPTSTRLMPARALWSSVQLADHLALRVEDLELDRILGLRSVSEKLSMACAPRTKRYAGRGSNRHDRRHRRDASPSAPAA